VLKGDLATAPLPEVLRSLAAAAATGCLRVQVGDERWQEAKVFLRTGKVYAVVLPDRRPQLGPRLVSSGDLDPAALAEAYEAQRDELQGWRLGELLVHLGYVDPDVVEVAVGEQLREAAFELLLWTAGTWRFRRDERTREDVARPVAVDDLLIDVKTHAAAWEALRSRVHGPDAVPVLSAAGAAPETLSLDGDAWSLLCTVDGTSSLSRLAGSSGLSLLEAAQVVVTLLDAGLVDVEPPEVPVEVEPAPVEVEPVPEPAAIASRLADALRGLGPVPVLPPSPSDPPAAAGADALTSTVMDGETPTRSLATGSDDEEVAGSLSRVSESLAERLGDTTETFDPFALPVAGLVPAPAAPLDEWEARRRALDAQELAERHAALEAEHAAELRAAREEITGLANQPAPAPADPVAEDESAADAGEDQVATSPDDHEAAPAPEPEPAPLTADEPSPDAGYAVRGADTAALLRELSSLGLDDEPETVPQQRSPAPPVVRPLTIAGPKKRKGLFGR
jgi:hypothetical protein